MTKIQIDEKEAIALLDPIIELAVEATDDMAERLAIVYSAVRKMLEEWGANVDWADRQWAALQRQEKPFATALVELMIEASHREEIEVPTHVIVTTVEKTAYF